MEEKNITTVFLSIIGIIAVVGFVLFITGTHTGLYTGAGGYVQLSPREACENIYCELAMVQQFNSELGGASAICACPTGLNPPHPETRYVTVSLLQKAEDKFPYSTGRRIKGSVYEVAGYPEGVPVVTTTEAYETQQRSVFQARYPGRTWAVLTSCQGIAGYKIPEQYTESMTYQEAWNRGLDITTDCVYTLDIIGGKGYCCIKKLFRLY